MHMCVSTSRLLSVFRRLGHLPDHCSSLPNFWLAPWSETVCSVVAKGVESEATLHHSVPQFPHL